MIDLLSKEHDCYKIHALLMKSITYAPSVDTQPLSELPSPHFYKKILNPFFYDTF